MIAAIEQPILVRDREQRVDRMRMRDRGDVEIEGSEIGDDLSAVTGSRAKREMWRAIRGTRNGSVPPPCETIMRKLGKRRMVPMTPDS